MTTFHLTLGDGVDALSASYEASATDAGRVIAHGMRRFGTNDRQEVVNQFAALFMGNLTAAVIADEQNIAAQAAREAVPEIIVTPVSE